MKKMLLLLVISMTFAAWRAPEYLEMAGIIKPDQAELDKRARAVAEKIAAERAAQPKVKPMSAEEFARLSKTDPEAYKKYVESYQQKDRGEADKLMNFFKTGEYK